MVASIHWLTNSCRNGRKLIVASIAASLIPLAAFQAGAEDQRAASKKPNPRAVRRIALSELHANVVKAAAKPVSNSQKVAASDLEDVVSYAVAQAHYQCFENDPFPSAKKCGACHPKHYKEWSVSPHSYAQLSPVANTLFMALNELVTGTIGDFCLRCHTPVGQALQEPRTLPNADRHPAAREGITCVVCHRINQGWGKMSGRMALVAGDVDQVVYGSLGSEILEEVLANPDKYGVLKTMMDSDVRGRPIHSTSYKLWQLSAPSFCGQCHDVVTPSGFRLEDAFSEYVASPAAREECTTCQDCHMGKIQGMVSGYFFEPISMVGNVATPPRKRTSHYFAGPDHSVIHPGIFPHNPEAVREVNEDPLESGLASIREWLSFDHKAGWGTDDYETEAAKHEDWVFPEPWNDTEKRRKARSILNDQFELLNTYTHKRAEVLSIGYQVGDIEGVEMDRKGGLRFKVKVSNGTTGHGVPTGFDAERPIWLQVVVWDRNNKVVFRSGDLDPNGDYRDDHSFFVHNGEIPRDRYLFSLQSKFITRNVRGNEREDILPVPFSLDPLSFNRPLVRPFSSLGRPLGARKHKQNIEPRGHRYAKYYIAPNRLTGCGPYKINVRLITGMVPVNLVHVISFAGFQYGLTAKEIADRLVEGHLVLHERCTQVNCHE